MSHGQLLTGNAAATGARVFTATSSQGLLYGFEVLYTIAGWRVPLVLVNVSRALSSPITAEEKRPSWRYVNCRKSWRN